MSEGSSQSLDGLRKVQEWLANEANQSQADALDDGGQAMTDPQPPNVPEWFEEFIIDCDQAPAFCCHADGNDEKFAFLRACVYEHLWREEAERREHGHDSWCKANKDYIGVCKSNAETCAQRARELNHG